MTFNRKKLIEELLNITTQNKAQAERFAGLSVEQLTFRKMPNSWNILECLEHLNRYGDFYIPVFERTLLAAQPAPDAHRFKAGILGNYFAKSMHVNSKGKMKTFASMNPFETDLDARVIDKFLLQQKKLDQLLHQAKQFDLTRLKTPISISKYLKLRLGDSLRVVIYHNERHIVQAQGVLKMYQAQVNV